MEERTILMEEMRRLNRLNVVYEKNILGEKMFRNEPELVEKNVLAMCQIANSLKV